MIVAKPVIEKQFWILQKDNEKIGNVEACDGGFQVRINDRVERYKTIKMVERQNGIHFETHIRSKPKKAPNMVHGYPAAGRVFNAVWDVPRHLPLYTKNKKSKSWFAAGWYTVKRGRNWRVVQDPKLITLDRYPYHGPFNSQEAAQQHGQ